MLLAEGWRKIYLSRSKTFLMFCFCFIGGIGFFTAVDIFSEWARYFYLAFWVGLCLLVVFWSRLTARLIIGMGLSVFLAGWRTLVWLPSADTMNIREIYTGKTQEFTAQVVAEPEREVTGTKYTLGRVRLNGEKVAGRILAETGVTSDFEFGDILTVRCRLRLPENFSGFNYQKYLRSRKIYALCSFPKMEKIGQRKNPVFFIYYFKNIVSQRTGELLAEPYAGLLSAILYGARAGLPGELKEDFQRTGLTHIVAVSGYNVGIISAAIFSLFLFLRINRKKIFLPAAVLIGIFVVFTGAGASVARAGLLGTVVLAGRHFGRPRSAGRLLVVAAALLLAINPYLLWYDAGFQLSFLAAAGIIYCCPIMENWRARKKIWLTASAGAKFLGEMFSVTVSATVATAPLILYQFGQISLVSLPANFLILWIIPAVMFVGTLAIGLSWWFYPLARMTAWAAQALLFYMIKVAEFFGGRAWSVATVELSLFFLFFIYGMMIFLTVNYWRKYEKDLAVDNF